VTNSPEDVLERRVEAAPGGGRRTPLDRADTMVLLVGAGSPEATANAEVARTARLLWERGYAGVETAFLSTAAPDVPAGLERCLRLGARRIVVLPCFPANAALEERVRQQADGWAQARPGVDLRHAAAGAGTPDRAGDPTHHNPLHPAPNTSAEYAGRAARTRPPPPPPLDPGPPPGVTRSRQSRALSVAGLRRVIRMTRNPAAKSSTEPPAR
jgi:hypothetical protein